MPSIHHRSVLENALFLCQGQSIFRSASSSRAASIVVLDQGDPTYLVSNAIEANVT
jgi:hypothetical protein